VLFNSLPFLIFFPVTTLLYFLLPHPRRWLLLLAASCWFYMAFIPSYILILFVLILVDYFAAIWMEAAAGRSRKLWLTASIVSNAAFLGVFKYYNFLDANLAVLADRFGFHVHAVPLPMLLPIGLSFHTFQSMSYTIEVYRGNWKAERHLGIYALYVMFYPQLVAGPIERPRHLLPQFRREHSADWPRMREGLKLMLVGFFKKVAIADTLALTVNAVYRSPDAYSAPSLLIALYFFAFQIYYDFSGYSDIARGAAKVLGFDLMVNFDQPYVARSASEFWHRWHISLSTWFRDYVYVPLGGGRVAPARRYLNLLITFLLSGFWHGANWTFIVWGAVHGAGLIVSDLAAPFVATLKGRFWKGVGQLTTFHFVVVTWIFFRAASMSQALVIFRKLGGGYAWGAVDDELGLDLVLISTALVLVMEIGQWLQRNGKLEKIPEGTLAGKSLRYAWVFASLAIIAARLTYDSTPQRFIYFQF
jgi:D-alanyl-lipoteichoic acid acyltransferase DltB (MBOAT superfamily)